MAENNPKVLFVSSSGKIFKLIPFIKSQYESLKPYVYKIDHYRVNGSGFRSYIVAYKELKIKLRRENFDVIHAHWTYAGILCSLLLKREKLVISFMGNDLQGFYATKYNIITFKGLINILLSQYLLFKVDWIIVKSARMLRWVPAWFRHKTEVLPNGVNLDTFKFLDQKEARTYLKLHPEQKYIAFIGDTADENKNFSLLKKAVLHLYENKINCEILAPYPIPACQVPFYLAAADVMAFPSKLEGSPNIIKEALAMRCPIVATDVGDVRERIANIRGCYISSFDEYEFSDKLKAALDFNDRIDSYNHLQEISETHIAKKIVGLYHRVLNNKRSNDSCVLQ